MAIQQGLKRGLFSTAASGLSNHLHRNGIININSGDYKLIIVLMLVTSQRRRGMDNDHINRAGNNNNEDSSSDSGYKTDSEDKEKGN
ncbi:hypothetical protein MKS88_001540 [Plasmodium brasilianum]|uniref:Uncharacterized protein n=2 Tax=Plasmodium (Plasmodium) TaxID=418103 RepID=A0A1D3JM39_PLAMA|nr:uncharacterized protein PMUG01_05040600 [Plasmodium malariae]KAI4840182.1 hypothetical protein MKS88_001540 [Plasmodium brasilianum]SBT87543.1 hypothetical protein PMUG01_05040600 [Plasmodium malariae]